MTQKEKNLLLKQAVKLTALGHKVETARSRLAKLVEQGVSYTDPQMLNALERFQRVDSDWKRLEAEHLALKEKMEPRGTKR